MKCHSCGIGELEDRVKHNRQYKYCPHCNGWFRKRFLWLYIAPKKRIDKDKEKRREQIREAKRRWDLKRKQGKVDGIQKQG